MTTFITILSIGVVLGFIGYAVLFGGKKKVSESGEVEEVGKTEQNRMDIEGKILNFLSENEKITNDDVEKLLGVADSTATKYLQRLENEGKLEQKGNTGRFVYYVRK